MPILTLASCQPHRPLSGEKGETLLSVLQKAGVELNCPCGGNHTCGKCRVYARGGLSAPTPTERELLAEGQALTPPAGFTLRLACFAQLEEDCTVLLPEAVGADAIALAGAGGDFVPEPLYDGAFGAAVDIGTTTVVAYLFGRQDTRPRAVLGQLNREQSYGADVLSRIDFSNLQGVEVLRDVIRGQLSEMLLELCRQETIHPAALSMLCITGNTTMLHLLAGLPPRTLALAPFTPVSFFDRIEPWALEVCPQAAIYTPPCISAYVGADITCSMLAARLTEQPYRTLLVDIGTNGEMALWNQGRLLCCSTAAGPAFEGAGISAGMTARSGAIDRVWAVNGGLYYTTIGNQPAVGLCGSGLIDAIAALLEQEIINKSGRMDKAYQGQAPLGDSGVCVSQADVRQLQLAKGAIRAGMDTLLHETGLDYQELEKIILCGGFGSYLDPRTAERIGLLPPGLASRTKAIGNAAGAGAGLILQSKSQQVQARAIAAQAQTVELSYSEFFRERYIQAMSF